MQYSKAAKERGRKVQISAKEEIIQEVNVFSVGVEKHVETNGNVVYKEEWILPHPLFGGEALDDRQQGTVIQEGLEQENAPQP